jgi:SAM-dependent methyltransferase
MECRLCGRTAVPMGERPGLVLVRCPGCRLVSAWPRAEVAAEDRYRHYHHAPAPAPPSARYHEWLARAEDQLGRGRLLEVGAGAGAFASTAKARGWRVDATEISETGVRALAGAGIEVFRGELAGAGYPDGQFDLAVALEVIEHLPRPGRELAEIRRILRPGGLCLVTTPNFNGLSRRLLGTRWRVIAPEHLVYFTPRTLRHALAAAGLSAHTIGSRGVDVTTWRSALEPGRVASFDPARSAEVRDRVNASSPLRAAKEALNVVLSALGAGDTLVAWARR